MHNPGELSMCSKRDLDVHTITLVGELDLATAGDVEHELRGAEEAGATTIVVDLAGLTFLDSSGVRLLILADARSRSNGHDLSLRRPPQHVRRVLEICGITEHLSLAD